MHTHTHNWFTSIQFTDICVVWCTVLWKGNQLLKDVESMWYASWLHNATWSRFPRLEGIHMCSERLSAESMFKNDRTTASWDFWFQELKTCQNPSQSQGPACLVFWCHAEIYSGHTLKAHAVLAFWLFTRCRQVRLDRICRRRLRRRRSSLRSSNEIEGKKRCMQTINGHWTAKQLSVI